MFYILKMVDKKDESKMIDAIQGTNLEMVKSSMLYMSEPKNLGDIVIMEYESECTEHIHDLNHTDIPKRVLYRWNNTWGTIDQFNTDTTLSS